MVGRADEMAILGTLLDDASFGQGGFACLEGVAGIGKTTPAQAVLDAVSVRGIATFKGAANELERTAPFGPLLAAFDVGHATKAEPA